MALRLDVPVGVGGLADRRVAELLLHAVARRSAVVVSRIADRASLMRQLLCAGEGANSRGRRR
jgi:hypothetical protein